MPRKKKAPSLKISPDPDYWLKFLKSQDLIPDFLEATPLMEEQPIDERELEAFLKKLAPYGYPSTLREFNALTKDEKDYYLQAFQIYKDGMKQRSPIQWIKQKLGPT